MNRVMLIGRACADAESRSTANGNNVCKLRMAIDGRTKDDTLFTTVTLFGKQAEIAGKYVDKGKLIAIEGRLSEDRWEDKEGNTRVALVVIGDRIELLGSGKKESSPEPVAVATDDGEPTF